MTSIGEFGFVLLLALIGLSPASACAQDKPDSVAGPTILLNPRIHSSGYFPFTGAILNRNPVFDVNLFYEKKAFGFFVFQSFDLADRHSYVNYLQPGVFATLRFHSQVRVRAFFGYIFSQAQSFRDPDSDYYAALQLNWQLLPNFRLENTLLYYDYTTNKKVANRLLLEWAPWRIRISGFLWHRNVIEEGTSSVSGAVAVTFPIIRLSSRANVEVTATYMGYLTESKPDYALNDGAFVTVAVPMKLGRQ
jgi:hypothetical protein